MNHHEDNIFSWNNFKQSSPEAQKDILSELDLENSLPNLPYRDQANTFIGAPADIILKYRPLCSWDAQVLIWKKSLPTGSRAEAKKLLHDEAKLALRLKRRKQCMA